MPTSPENETSESPAAESPPDTGELIAELERLEDRYKRAVADLDNYRKRTERDGDRRVAEARQALLRDWLEAVDSVERALRLEPGDPGLTAVLEQMEAILARQGAARVGVAGERFDPERHEAVGVVPAVELPDGVVVEVARSGFGLGDGRLLRPAQVLVSRRPAD
jgi:molecular chaperone GrpE